MAELTKQDVIEAINEVVPGIVKATINETVPDIVKDIINDTVPGIVHEIVDTEIEKFAVMVKAGFDSVDESFEQVYARFDIVDERLARLEEDSRLLKHLAHKH